MLKTILAFCVCLPLLLVADTAPEPDLKKLSETFGNLIGRSLKGPGFSFDMDSLIQGIKNGADGKPAPLTDQEYELGMAAVQEKLISHLAEENLKAANEFLAKNAKEPDVRSLENGKLQFKIIKNGSGEVVPAGGTPEINFTGKLADGEVFTSSDEMGPITIDLSKTVPGFSKGIAGMKEGEKRTLFIHPDLAYGTQGQLPPNSLLIFDVEVLKATSPKEAENAASQVYENAH